MRDDGKQAVRPVAAMLARLEELLARSDALSAEHLALLEEAEALMLAIDMATGRSAMQHEGLAASGTPPATEAVWRAHPRCGRASMRRTKQ